jgi:uncharacterized protein (DUF58 family)
MIESSTMLQRAAAISAVPLSPAARRAYKNKTIDFSVTGLVYVAMMFFMGMAAMNSQANLLFGVFGLMIGILLVAGVISRQVLRKLSLVRVLPEHAIVGQPVIVTYDITNDKRFWPSLSVTIAELDGAEGFRKQPQAYLLHAAARMTATVPVEFVPRRRGLLHFDRYQVRTSFPFGFIKRAFDRRHKDTLLVYPALAMVDPRALALFRSAETSGAMMRPRRGGTDEFYGVKEYRSGENPRWIYWRRSARTGTLVSKEMTHVSPPRLMLMVDTFVPEPTAAHFEAAERCVAIAASLANLALESGLPVGLAAWSDEWVTIAPNRGKRHRRDLLTALATLPVNMTREPGELFERVERHQKSGATAVLITPRDVRLSLGEHARGGLVVLSPGSPHVQRYFKFDPAIDFSRTMPVEK